MQVEHAPPATLQEMRGLTMPVANKCAAPHDPAGVKVYREELDKAHANVR